MPSAYQTFPIEFRGGLVSNLSLLQQGTNAVGSATILQNFEVNKEGGYSKIKGYEKYSDTAVPGSGPILALKVISSGRIVAARKNATNYTEYYYGTGTTWVSMDISASTNGGKARHATFNFDGDDKVVFVDGTNYPAVYNTSGNTMTFLTSADSPDVSGAEHVAIFSNAAFYAKGQNLFMSAPFTVDDFSPANLGGETINVGADITGLAVFREQLIIFTTDSIKRLSGKTAADFSLTSITDRIGCINGDTIQEVGGDIMFLAPDGLRLLSATDRIGDFGLGIPSDKITKDASKFLASSSDFCSVIFREKAQYRIFAYVASEQAGVAKGLIATKFQAQGADGFAWSTTTGIKAYVADSRYTGTEETVAFANTDGYVYQMDVGKDFDGSNIDAIFETPYMPISDPQIRKSFYKLTLYAEPTGSMNLDLNLKYDFGTGTDPGVIQPETETIESTGNEIFLFGASGSTFTAKDSATDDSTRFGGELDTVYDKHIIGSGKTIAIRIEDRSTNPIFTLDTAILEFRQHDRQ